MIIPIVIIEKTGWKIFRVRTALPTIDWTIRPIIVFCNNWLVVTITKPYEPRIILERRKILSHHTHRLQWSEVPKLPIFTKNIAGLGSRVWSSPEPRHSSSTLAPRLYTPSPYHWYGLHFCKLWKYMHELYQVPCSATRDVPICRPCQGLQSGFQHLGSQKGLFGEKRSF